MFWHWDQTTSVIYPYLPNRQKGLGLDEVFAPLPSAVSKYTRTVSLRMKASDLFVQCLEEEGIEYIFGVPGEENADFMLSLEKSSQIKFILTQFGEISRWQKMVLELLP